MNEQPQIDNKATGEIEPKAIIFIGGPLNGRKMADRGQCTKQTPAGDLYKRVRMDARDSLGQLVFDVLAYFGKSWEQGIETGAANE